MKKKIMNYNFGSSTTGEHYAGMEALVDKELTKEELITRTLMVIHLFKEGVLTSKQAKILMKAIEELKEEGFDVTAETWDVHYSFVVALKEKLGKKHENLAEDLTAAEHYNGILATDLALYSRKVSLGVAVKIVEVMNLLLAFVGKYKDAIYFGTSHEGQPTEITTIGHIFAGYLPDLQFYVEMLLEIANTEGSPFGSHNGWGIVYAPDRKLYAKLLQMEPTSHTTQGFSNRTMQVSNILFPMLGSISTIHKMALCVLELTKQGIVGLPDCIIAQGDLEPYRKKPEGVEYIGRMLAFLSGYLQQAMSCMTEGSTPGYRATDSVSKIALIQGVDATKSALDKAIVLLDGLSVNTDKAQKVLKVIPFFYSNNIHTRLVFQEQLDPSKAKKLLVKAMSVAEESGENRITYVAMKEAAKQLKIEIKITKEELNSWQNPYWIVDQKNQVGMPGNLENDIEDYKNIFTDLTSKIDFIEKGIVKSNRLIQIELNKIKNAME